MTRSVDRDGAACLPPSFGAAGLSRAAPRQADEPALAVDQLFAMFADAPAVLLAVSGGPDSIALMLLAARWAAARRDDRPDGAPRLYVATVDHGLRPGSGAEADMVAAAAAGLGLPHATLPWLGDKPRARIEERARAARYALLAAEAERVGASHLVTAHHADDQAETILFRLARGSGLGGLAGMRPETRPRPGLILARPLLGIEKARLVAICRAAGEPVVDDPMNRDPAYARARLRAEKAAALRLGLDTPTLSRLARRLARAEDALEAEARRRLAALEPRLDQGQFTARLAPLRDAEPEFVIRVLRLALEAALPDGKPLRLDRLERLADGVLAALRAGEAHRATLGGARVTLSRDTMLRLAPEAPRRRGRAGDRPESAARPANSLK